MVLDRPKDVTDAGLQGDPVVLVQVAQAPVPIDERAGHVRGRVCGMRNANAKSRGWLASYQEKKRERTAVSDM